MHFIKVGSGKSTLIKMILEGDISIKTANGAKIGYFSQDMNILKAELSILENVMENSIYDEPTNYLDIYSLELISKISMPSKKDDPQKLDKEYYEVLKRLQELKRERK